MIDHLALDRPLERLAVLHVVEHLLNQLAAVADVLDRMRQVVDQAGGDAPEHRLAFLLPDVLLQLDEPSAIELKASPSWRISSWPVSATRSSSCPPRSPAWRASARRCAG